MDDESEMYLRRRTDDKNAEPRDHLPEGEKKMLGMAGFSLYALARDSD